MADYPEGFYVPLGWNYDDAVVAWENGTHPGQTGTPQPPGPDPTPVMVLTATPDPDYNQIVDFTVEGGEADWRFNFGDGSSDTISNVPKARNVYPAEDATYTATVTDSTGATATVEVVVDLTPGVFYGPFENRDIRFWLKGTKDNPEVGFNIDDDAEVDLWVKIDDLEELGDRALKYIRTKVTKNL